LSATQPFPPATAPACSPYCLFNLAEDPCEMTNLATKNASQLGLLLGRLAELSKRPVPFDSCLPDCTAAMACGVSKSHYSGFFGPYFPPSDGV
jgi:hypothetical protein